MARDYYEVLGVKPDATAAEIRAAYIRLLKEWHPDTNKSAQSTARMQEINAAYDCLKDTMRRAAYDRRRKDEAERARRAEEKPSGTYWQEPPKQDPPRQEPPRQEPPQQPRRPYEADEPEEDLIWGLFTKRGLAAFFGVLVALHMFGQFFRPTPPAPPPQPVQETASVATPAPATPEAPVIDRAAEEARRKAELEAERLAKQDAEFAEQKRKRAAELDELKRKQEADWLAQIPRRKASMRIISKMLFDVPLGQSPCTSPLIRGMRCSDDETEHERVGFEVYNRGGKVQFGVVFWPYVFGLIPNPEFKIGLGESGALGKLTPEARASAVRILMRAGFTHEQLEKCEYEAPKVFNTKVGTFSCGKPGSGYGPWPFQYGVFMAGQVLELKAMSDMDLADSTPQADRCANKVCAQSGKVRASRR